MGRWEPGARERLEESAMALFLERGYDDTAVADIAAHAGLTKSTFFRHFTDKREVLFGSQDALLSVFGTAIATAGPEATALDAVESAVTAATTAFPPERRELARVRHKVVQENSELLERQLLKRTHFTAALIDALTARGVARATAEFAAGLGVLAFGKTFERWVQADETATFAEIAESVFEDLRSAMASTNAALGQPTTSG